MRYAMFWPHNGDLVQRISSTFSPLYMRWGRIYETVRRKEVALALHRSMAGGEISREHVRKFEVGRLFDCEEGVPLEL